MAGQKLQRSLGRRGASQPPRSRAFFLELLLNMLIFALCAVVALQVFVEGKLATSESAALTTLTLDAETLAETYKVSDGNLDDLMLFTAGEEVEGDFSKEGELTYYYNSSLELTDAENARYSLVLTPVEGVSELVSDIEIVGYSDERELLRLEVAQFKPKARG